MITEEFDVKNVDEFDDKIDMSYWNDVDVINDYWDNHKIGETKLNGIIEVRYGNEIYKTWKVEFIRSHICKFLKEKYPNSLIVRELNDVDLTVIDRITPIRIPVEIQKTPLQVNKTFAHALFEKTMRPQIDINIKIYGKCWLFFDSEYLRFLQSKNVGKNASVDLTWIIKLMNENILKVFVIKYDGIVKELTIKDFDFLKEVSQTCQIGYDNDERTLNRNKVEIYNSIMFEYNFTQEEITQFENEFDNHKDDSKTSVSYFTKSNNERCNLYGQILQSIKALIIINNILSCTVEKFYTSYAVTLGLFHQNEFHGSNNDARIQFVDKFNIAQYFPGYLRNKEMWDYCKNKYRIFTIPEFIGIIEGREHCLKLIKQQSTMSDY